jgi:hypothetical protein
VSFLSWLFFDTPWGTEVKKQHARGKTEEAKEKKKHDREVAREKQNKKNAKKTADKKKREKEIAAARKRVRAASRANAAKTKQHGFFYWE